MIDKIKVGKDIFSFMCNSLSNFFTSYFSNRLSEKKSDEISEIQFEREFRKNIEEIDQKVCNIEAIVYQEMQLYNNVINKLLSNTTLVKTDKINFYGNVYITINIDSKSIINLEDLERIIFDSANDLLVIDDNTTTIIDNKEAKSDVTKFSLKRVIDKNINRIKEVREVE